METRFESPAHRSKLVADVLAGSVVADYYHAATMPVVHDRASASELRKLLADPDVPFPLTVINAKGVPCGIVTMGTIRSLYFQESAENLAIVDDMSGPLVVAVPDEPLVSVMQKFETSGYSRIPVCSGQNPAELLGYIQYQDIMAAYQRELERQRVDF